jgi:OHCU decarboxylase
MEHVLALAEQAWWELDADDWREALDAHPRIGERTEPGSREAHEQGSMSRADEAIREEIASGNRAYEQRFGMTYVVRAVGRSPTEMLAMLRERLGNDPQAELRVAAAQQAEITRLRLIELLREMSAA